MSGAATGATGMTALTWLGHGTWLLETSGQQVLIDPFLDDNPASPIKSDDVEPGFLLISHGHSDHIADAVQIAQRTNALAISNYEITTWLAAQGVQRTHGMNLGGGYSFPFGRVQLTIAHHSSVLPDGTPGGNPSGFLITLADRRRLYFACDTALFGDMRLIGEGGLELAVLPIGDNFTMGPDDALRAVQLLAPRRVVPSHFNTWPLIAQDATAWAERVRHVGAEPVLLKPGERLEV